MFAKNNRRMRNENEIQITLDEKNRAAWSCRECRKERHKESAVRDEAAY